MFVDLIPHLLQFLWRMVMFMEVSEGRYPGVAEHKRVLLLRKVHSFTIDVAVGLVIKLK